MVSLIFYEQHYCCVYWCSGLVSWSQVLNLNMSADSENKRAPDIYTHISSYVLTTYLRDSHLLILGLTHLLLTNLLETVNCPHGVQHSLGLPTTWSMLNTLRTHPGELMSLPGMNKDLITKYLELYTATAKGHLVRVQNNMFSQHMTTNWLHTRHAKR